jgi:hypothetical protein
MSFGDLEVSWTDDGGIHRVQRKQRRHSWCHRCDFNGAVHKNQDPKKRINRDRNPVKTLSELSQSCKAAAVG